MVKEIKFQSLFLCETCCQKHENRDVIQICPLCDNNELCDNCTVYLYQLLSKEGYESMAHLILEEVDKRCECPVKICRKCAKSISDNIYIYKKDCSVTPVSNIILNHSVKYRKRKFSYQHPSQEILTSFEEILGEEEFLRAFSRLKYSPECPELEEDNVDEPSGQEDQANTFHPVERVSDDVHHANPALLSLLRKSMERKGKI